MNVTTGQHPGITRLVGLVVAVFVTGNVLRADNAPSSTAQTALMTISWRAVHDRQPLKGASFAPADNTGPDRLRLVHEALEPRLFVLHEWSPPKIPQSSYVLRGRVKYESVQGIGYLELLNQFPSRGSYFTRTLGQGGPMGQLTGTSDWRDVILPFYAGDAGQPEKLVLNLSLAGPGIVELTDLELWSPADELPTTLIAGAWWSDRMGGLVGGLGGAFLGVFLGGCLAPLTAMGRARGFVLASLLAIGVLCTGLLILGVLACAIGQPYGVYYPLLLLGGLGAVLSAVGFRQSQLRYHEWELRRMTSLDVVS
jgi:hypothetical protein